MCCTSVRLLTAAACLLAVSCAKRMPVRGMVLRVDPPERTVIVSHQRIPGYMEAMVMPFRVRHAEDLSGLRPGAQIDFQLVVRKDRSYIERVKLRAVATEGVAEEQIRLVEPAGKLAIGDAAPDFKLIDQLGRDARSSDFRGRVVAVAFIYTRCPLPEVCPRLSANFARLQRRFETHLGRDLVLLSITLDPGYDTPATLLEYAKIWKARPEGWRFLTGPQPEIEALARGFGMSFWAEDGAITHNSRTAVLSRAGRLAAVVDGSSYQVGQLGDLIEKELENP